MLAEAAARIAGAARAVDTVGRIGGEEFAWLLPGDDAEAALVAAHRLRDTIRERPFAAGLDVTASMGICDIATAGDGDALLRRADEALYWAKAFGRDAALVWSPATAARIERARDGDHDDADHGRRVAAIAIALAEARGWAPAAQARLHRAALVHDIGKVALPDAMLNRPGPLTPPSSSTSASTRGSAPRSRRSTPSRRRGSATTTNAGTVRLPVRGRRRRDPRGHSCWRSRMRGTR